MALLDLLKPYKAFRPKGAGEEPVTTREFYEAQLQLERSLSAVLSYLRGHSENVAFAASRAANGITLTTGSDTVLTYDTEELDSHDAFDPSTGEFTVPLGFDGPYLFAGSARVPGIDAAEVCRLNLQVNSANKRLGGVHQSAGADQTITAHLATVVDLDVGDVVKLSIFHNEGANQTQNTLLGANWFAGARIR